MIRRIICLFSLLLFWASFAYGQRDGVDTFSATDGEVNLTSLVPTISIPLLPKSAGVLPGSLAITSPQSCQPYWTGSNFGTSCGSTSTTSGALAAFYFTPQEMQDMQVSYTFVTSGQPPNQCTTYTIGGLIGFDQLSFYPLSSTLLYYPSTCGVNTATLTTINNTGITVSLSSVNGAPIITSLHNSSGWGETISTSNTLTDPFGNTTVLSGTSFTDSLGAATTLSGSPLPTSYQYTDAGGTSRTISFTNGTATTFYPFDTSCGIGNAGASVTPVSSISYPDGTSVSFTWDTTPISGHSGTIDGLIKSVTLRTGGTITYTYGSLSRGCAFGGLRAGWAFGSLSRQTPDGTTTYTAGTWTGGYSVTVLDPGKNKTVYDFAGTYNSAGNEGGIFIQQVYRYQNTGTVGTPAYTLISNTKYCYNTDTHCDGTAIPSYPITQRDTYEYVGTGSTQMSHDVRLYDSTYGLLTSDANTDSITSQTITTTYVYGTDSSGTCVAITNTNIHDHPCTITTKNGSTWLSGSTYSYNSNGALTSSSACLSSTCTGSSALTTTYTPTTQGTYSAIQDPNGQTVNYTYGSCNSLMPTDVTTTVNSIAIDRKATWNCNAGLVTDTTDPNSNEDDYTYDSMNRLHTYHDYMGDTNTTTYDYGTPTLDHVKVTDNIGVVSYQYNDGLGRPTNSQVCQTSGCSNLDTSSKSYAWNGVNFETKTYVPCVQTTLNTACTTVAVTADVNPMGPSTTTDANSGTGTVAVNSKDLSFTAGPAPSQENTKVVQTEVDGFGRTTSVCALTSTGYNGRVSCGQTMGGSGTLTSNVYSFATGAPKVVTTRGSQSHTTIADAVGRPTSLQTPEAGTTTYTYDSIASGICNAGASSSAGDLVETVDAASNKICRYYEGLHRLTDIDNSSESSTNPCRRFRYDSVSAAKIQNAPTGYPSSGNNIIGRMFEAETDNCVLVNGHEVAITDEWFAYDAMGRITDMWEYTSTGATYYHTTVAYDADGVPTSLAGIPGVTTITYTNDGEDRWNTAKQNTTTLISGVTYDAASRATEVDLGSGTDKDKYSFDNVGNMTQYQFFVGSANNKGALTWNSIGSLGTLAITDGLNTNNTQTCNFGSSTVEGYDDVGRLLSDNCGTVWAQTYSYDQYDNITKSGSSSWGCSTCYSSSNNQQTSTPALTYDSDGNMKSDGTNTYTWNVYGKMASENSTNATYDAFGNMVVYGSYEYLYSPMGKLGALSSGGTYVMSVPAPGGMGTLDTRSGPTNYYYHGDWLGSARTVSNIASSAVTWSKSFSPYGDVYNTGTDTNDRFAGIDGDTFSGLTYIAPARALAHNASRWLSPDPAHSGWNAYAYVTDPNTQTDRLGLCGSDGTGPCLGLPSNDCSVSAASDCEFTSPDVQTSNFVFQGGSGSDDSEGQGAEFTDPVFLSGWAGGDDGHISRPTDLTHRIGRWVDTRLLGEPDDPENDDEYSHIEGLFKVGGVGGEVASPIYGGGYILNGSEAAGYVRDTLNASFRGGITELNINRFYYREMFYELADLAEGKGGPELAGQATKAINMMRGVGSPIQESGIMPDLDLHNAIIENGPALTNYFNEYAGGQFQIAVSPEARYAYMMRGAFLTRRSLELPIIGRLGN